MKLQSVAIRNFRSVKDLAFEFPESGILVLVGANNSGKSNIITAIDALCGDAWFGREKMEDHDFYLRDRGRPFSIELGFDNGRFAKLTSAAKWPEYLEANGAKRYTPVKEDFPCTYLGADRTLDRHLSFHDWTLIGKIRRAFHQRAAPLQEQLRDKFLELSTIFQQVPGFAEFCADFGRFFAEMQADTPARMEIGFQPFTPSNYFKTMQILARDPSQGGTELDLSELGEGSRNTILIALLRSYAANFRHAPDGAVSGILALEEPEIFLHPQARRHLYGVLREIAASGVQVMISTHSASFVDTEHFDSIGQVVKLRDSERQGAMHSQLILVDKQSLIDHCLQTGVPTGKVTTENITEFYRTTSNYRLNEAFFAKYVVLVEGETEELALPEYLRRAGIDCDLQSVSMISVAGKNQIPRYWRLFGLFKPGCIAVVFDNDAGSPAKAASNANLRTCFRLSDEQLEHVDGYDVLMPDVQPETPVFVLDTDFETAVRKAFAVTCPEEPNLIAAYEADARRLIKPVGDQGKGLIARHVARRLGQSHPDFVPDFVSVLAQLMIAELEAR